MYPVLCNNTHYDVTDLVNHEMIKNTKIEYIENGTSLFHKIKKFLTCTPDDTF